MRLLAALALLTATTQARADCSPNADIIDTVQQLSPFGITSRSIEDVNVIGSFALITGFPGDPATIKRLIFLFGRPDGSSLVFLMGAETTCHRMSTPTAAAKALYVQLMGTPA